MAYLFTCLVLVIVMNVFVAPIVASEASGGFQVSLQLSHNGPLTAEGRAHVSCQSRYVLFTGSRAENLTVTFEEATLRLWTTWANTTVLHPNKPTPVVVPRGGRHHEEMREMPGRDLHLSWTGMADRMGLKPVSNSSRLDSELLEIRADATGATVKEARLMEVAEDWWYADATGAPHHEIRLGKQRWSRVLEAASNLTTVRGDVRLHLAQVEIRDAEGETFLVGAEEHRSSSNGFVTHRDSIYRRAVLDLTGAEISVPSGALSVQCHDLVVEVDGRVRWSGVSGTIEHSGGNVTLQHNELEMTGAFSLNERMIFNADGAFGGRINVTGEGLAQSVRSDFVVVGIPTPLPADFPVKEAVWAATILAILAAGIKLLWPLFSRVRIDNVLGYEPRRDLVQTLATQGMMSFQEMCRQTGVNASTMRYHLRQLVRHGKVKRTKVKGLLFYVPNDQDLESVVKQRALEMDTKMQDLVNILRAGELAAGIAANLLQQRWGLSRSGSWRVIDRANLTGIVKKERRNGRMMLWPSV